MSISAPFPACPAILAEWAPLAAELAVWAGLGRRARLWWRDDDAVAPSPALDRLLTICSDIPLALAVIPDGVQPALAARLAGSARVTVVQHGIAHRNHAGPGEKKIELGGMAERDSLLDGLMRGRDRLGTLFGGQFSPVLVPPWNRIRGDVSRELPNLGFRALSAVPPAGLLLVGSGIHPPGIHPPRLDIEVDPVAWREGKSPRPAAEIASQMAGLLAERRECREFDRPLGFLTHHLLDSPAIEAVMTSLADLTRTHPGCRWISLDEGLGLGAGR